MNLHNNIPGRIEYIQKVFLGVQAYMQQNHTLEELIAFIDTEPLTFRSVAYESASMEVALTDIGSCKSLRNWKRFYNRSIEAHTFHMDIGLGWAFAKLDISPKDYIEPEHSIMLLMIYDGMGYYHGLFKGRKTIKSQLIPTGIEHQNLHGFDQGLGRRLWYISKGEVTELVKLIHLFPSSRRADLWRGVGIACGYVGGCDEEVLEQLLILSQGFNKQLSIGIALAAISRNASKSISNDIVLACNIICQKTIENVLLDYTDLKKHLVSELEIII